MAFSVCDDIDLNIVKPGSATMPSGWRSCYQFSGRLPVTLTSDAVPHLHHKGESSARACVGRGRCLVRPPLRVIDQEPSGMHRGERGQLPSPGGASWDRRQDSALQTSFSLMKQAANSTPQHSSHLIARRSWFQRALTECDDVDASVQVRRWK